VRALVLEALSGTASAFGLGGGAPGFTLGWTTQR